MTLTGLFVDVVGLAYESATTKGIISANFEYTYQPGEKVKFSVGRLVLGTCVGKPITTVTDLAPADTPTFHPHLINRARLLFSLTQGQGFEHPVKINENVSQITVLLSPAGFFQVEVFAIDSCDTGRTNCHKVCCGNQTGFVSIIGSR